MKTSLARQRPGASREAPAASEFELGLRELRASIANLRAGADALNAAVRSRGARAAELLSTVVAEAERASRAVDRLAAVASREGAGAVSGTALPVARFAGELARRAADELDLAVRLSQPAGGRLLAPPDLLAAVLGALGRLRRDFGVGEVELSFRRHADLLALDLAFSAREPESSRLREEHASVLASGARGEPALGDTARAAGGEAWLAIRRGEATFSLRILLPRSTAR